MLIMKLDANLYELSDKADPNKWWTVFTGSPTGHYITSAAGNVIKPSGPLGKKLVKALNEWLASRP